MRIAVVGGIGAGKSTVLDVARSLGIKTLSADEINAELMRDKAYIAKIANAFPSAVQNGVINRAELAKLVFNDDGKRSKLNAIAHPLILERIKADTSDPLAVEMPLLIESGAADMFDEIVLVCTPAAVRILRVKLRKSGHSHTLKRMRAQVKEKELKAVATRVLYNSGSKQRLIKNATVVFEDILKKSNK